MSMESDGIGVAAFAACDVAMKQLPAYQRSRTILQSIH